MNYTEIEIEGMKEILRDKEEEIKKLNERVKLLEEENNILKDELMEDMKTETKLNERIRFLEQCLDNKEKVNKSLREELENLKDNIKNQN